jgi:hypothetical protein
VTPEHAPPGPPVIESADGTGSTDTGALGEAAQPGSTTTLWRSDAALAPLALGAPAEARALATEEVALAQGYHGPRALGIALRSRASPKAGGAASKWALPRIL